MRETNRGYSLIEVLIAIAIMGSVFLSIVSLFYLGRRTVYSGKQMTQAVAVGTHVMEDLSQLSLASVYTSFVINNTNTLVTYKIAGTTYSNALIRTTNSSLPLDAGSDPLPASHDDENDPDVANVNINGFLTTWRNEMINTNKFQNGSVTLILRPTNPTNPILDATGRPEATVLQIRAIVQWREATRPRSVIIDSAKLRRE